MRVYLNILWVLVALLSVTLTVFNLWGGTIREDVVSSYVEVRCPDGVGSGVVLKVKEETLILTAAHVAEGLTQKKGGITRTFPARLRWKPTPSSRAKEVLADVVQCGKFEGGVDLALLRPRSCEGLTPAIFDPDTQLEVGEDCWYIGTTAGIHARLEKSILSQLDQTFPDSKGTYFAVNGCAYFGNSGGGVFVQRERGVGGKCYCLCGIITRGGEDYGKNPKCIGYAVDHATIKTFLAHYTGEGQVKK